ncbi:MAG: cytochrome c [Pseudomonadales bacterium]|nr:cytochrome c [Pseudomonadales bacterium]
MKKIFVTVGFFTIFSCSAIAADIAAGKAKATMCAACHGATGISNIPIYPNLAGQKSAYLAKQLKDFKAGNRQAPVMSSMAMTLSDLDIENVSAYFSSLKP